MDGGKWKAWLVWSAWPSPCDIHANPTPNPSTFITPERRTNLIHKNGRSRRGIPYEVVRDPRQRMAQRSGRTVRPAVPRETGTVHLHPPRIHDASKAILVGRRPVCTVGCQVHLVELASSRFDDAHSVATTTRSKRCFASHAGSRRLERCWKVQQVHERRLHASQEAGDAAAGVGKAWDGRRRARDGRGHGPCGAS